MTGTWVSGWATGDIVTAAEFKKGAGSISDTTLGGSAANIDITGILGTYGHLLVTLYGRGDVAAISTPAIMRFNGDSAANYDYQLLQGSAASTVSAETFAATFGQIGQIPANTAGANLFGATQVFIPNYGNSTNNKQFVAISSCKTGTATTNQTNLFFGGAWRSNAAINRITILPGSTNLVAGTRLTIHALGV